VTTGWEYKKYPQKKKGKCRKWKQVRWEITSDRMYLCGRYIIWNKTRISTMLSAVRDLDKENVKTCTNQPNIHPGICFEKYDTLDRCK